MPCTPVAPRPAAFTAFCQSLGRATTSKTGARGPPSPICTTPTSTPKKLTPRSVRSFSRRSCRRLYVAFVVDVFSRRIVGWKAARTSEPQQGAAQVLRRFLAAAESGELEANSARTKALFRRDEAAVVGLEAQDATE